MAKLASTLVTHHQRTELAAQQFGKLGTRAVNIRLTGFIPAPGDGTASRFDTLGSSVIDNAVEFGILVLGLDQAAQRRNPVKLIALGGKTGGAGLNNLPDSCLFAHHHSLLPPPPIPSGRGEEFKRPLN